MWRAAKRDGNHGDIVRALRAVGCSVADTAALGAGFPDMVVGTRRRTLLMEVKDGSLPPSAQALTPAQKKFHAQWRGEIVVVSSVKEALDAALNDVSPMRGRVR